MNGGIDICVNDFFSERVLAGGFETIYADADVFAVFDFEIDVFSDDRIVAITKYEEPRLNALGFEGADLTGLTLFDKPGEFAAI